MPDPIFPDHTETGRLARDHDWSRSPLGTPGEWPLSLRTIAALVLRQGMPQCVCWGPELRQVYNDGYRIILGDKHPAALGTPVLETWSEIAGDIEPLFARVLAGETVYFEDLHLRVQRNGETQDAFFTFSYSPVLDESGVVGGALVNCVETTNEVLGRRATAERDSLLAALKIEEARLRATFQQSPSFLAILRGRDNVFESVNAAYQAMIGHGRALVGKPLFEALPETRGQGFDEYLERVRTTGEPLVFRELPVSLERRPGAPREEIFVDITYLSLVEADGTRDAVIAHGTDVTEQVNARRAAASQAHELERANAQLRDNAAQLEAAANVLEAMADAYFVLDAEYHFVTINAAMERNVAQAREQLIGRTIWEVFPGTVDTIFGDAYRKVVNEGVEVHFTGEYVDGGLDLVPEVDAYPTAQGGVAVFWRDIRDRRRMEYENRMAREAAESARADAEAAEARLRDVFEQTPVAVAVLSGPDHVYTIVSPQYARTPGLGRKLLGRTMVEAFPEVDGTGFPNTMHRVYETGIAYSATERQLWLARPDGVMEEHFFNIGYQPLRNAAGEVYAIASAAYDVTEQVNARRDVEAARVEAEKQRALAEAANAAKSQFLSTMSHELRTPLNAISGYTELLSMGIRGAVTEQQKQDLERISRASNHLMGLVTDVLNFARIDARQVEFHVADFDVSYVVGDIEPIIAPQVAAKQLSFDADGCATGADGRRYLVHADPEKLRQVLLNLLVNAVKFTDPGGRIRMACGADEAAGVVRISVSDTGRGIPADQLDRIFEPFVQVDRHRTQESQQGVGLGLAISRDLARGMGGDLAVESEVGAGSTFTVTLRGSAAKAG